jgi:hypothetical protein
MPTPQKFSDIELVAAWGRLNGNIAQVAKELDVTRRAVKVRKALLPDALFAVNVKEFRQKRADLLAEIQRVALLHVLDVKKLKKASPAQLMTLMAIAYDKERLEQNLSTENIAHDQYHRLDKEDKKLLATLIHKRTEKKLQEVVYDGTEDQED